MNVKISKIDKILEIRPSMKSKGTANRVRGNYIVKVKIILNEDDLASIVWAKNRINKVLDELEIPQYFPDNQLED